MTMAYPSALNNVQQADRMARLLRKTNVERLTDEPQGLSNGVGRSFFVNSGSTNAASTNSGLEPLTPFATLQQAIDASVASRGDIIYVSAGHAETTTVAITINKAGVTIIGLGKGRNRPSFTVGHTADGINIAAANVTLSGLYFVTPTAAATSFIDVGGADAEIFDCEFDCGANAAHCVTVPAAGLRPYIRDCIWRVSANGPSEGIIIESATVDGARLERLRSFGGSTTNAWDLGFIYSTFATTGLQVDGIYNDFGPTFVLTGAATGRVNDVFGGDVAAGASQANFGTGALSVTGGPALGYLTRRATADILTAGSTNIFTVTGRVLVYGVIYSVTTVIGAGADTQALLFTPTAGDAVTIGAASASIATKAVGDTFSLSPSPAAATYSLAINVAGVGTMSALPILLTAGILAAVSTNNTTGSIRIDVYWRPEPYGGAGGGVVII